MVDLDMGEQKRKSSVRDQIDENLKRVYEEALEEEIPDRFAELLKRLKAQDAPTQDESNGNGQERNGRK